MALRDKRCDGSKEDLKKKENRAKRGLMGKKLGQIEKVRPAFLALALCWFHLEGADWMRSWRWLISALCLQRPDVYCLTY